jgi:WD40 repeat protein
MAVSFIPFTKPVTDLAPGGNLIAIGSTDGTIQVIKAMSQDLVFVTTGHKGPVSALAWSPNGKWIVSGGSDCIVRVWDADNGAAVARFAGHSQPISSLAWSPDSTRVASSSGQEVQRWNVEEALRLPA